MQKRQSSEIKAGSLDKLKHEWGIFLYAFFRPMSLGLIFLSGIAIYFSSADNIPKAAGYFLLAVATLFGSIAASFLYDVLKQLSEATVLMKKGISAVRNLSLARSKTKNIFQRCIKEGSIEEITNLLTLLEKDIANATEEWNDILPGVGEAQQIFILLSEKEGELDVLKNEKTVLEKNLVEARQSDQNKKDELQKKLDEKEVRIRDLSSQIVKFKSTEKNLVDLMGTNLYGQPTSASALALASGNLFGRPTGLSSLLNSRVCTKCGASFVGGSTILTGSICSMCGTVN